ncbi:MAG: TSUP family transporter [Clostridium sp.]
MYLLYFVISLLSCIIGSVGGIGGGFIIKPLVSMTGTLGISEVSFLSACTVLAMAIMTLLRSKNSDVKIEKRKSTILAIGAVIGGIIGKIIFQEIGRAYGNFKIVGAMQSAVLILVIILILIFTLNKKRFKTYDVGNIYICIGTGIVLGAIAAFIGIGGGPLNLTILFILFSMEGKTAALNSIYIILFSQLSSILYAIFTKSVPNIDGMAFIFMVVGGILGGLIAPSISKKISNKKMDIIYIAVLIFIVFISGFNLLKVIV